MLTIHVRADTSALDNRVRNAPKRIAYAVVNAINSTAKLAQSEVRKHAGSAFKIRKRQFIERQVAIIKPFASVGKARPYAEISVGQKPRLLLPQFEAGGVRQPFKGRNTAVPIVGGARPSPAAPVPEALQFKQLGFQRLGTRSHLRRQKAAGQKPIWVGRLGTYLIPGVGVFQRLGSAAARALYVFVKRVTLKPTLKFVSIVTGTAQRHFPRLLREQVNEALERARRK